MSRYRRKAKDTRGSLPHPHEQHAPKPQHAHPNRDEPGIQVHDEADLIQFRSDALNRFISNQEYMEKVTSMAISSSKIVPPSMFPVATPRPPVNANADEHNPTVTSSPGSLSVPFSTLALELVRSEQIYFGDLEWMKLESERMVKEMDLLRKSSEGVKFRNMDLFHFQSEASNKLTKLHQDLVNNRDGKSYALLQNELDNVIREYEQKFTTQKISDGKSFKKYSVKIDDVVVTEAPANYNPKLVNTYINFYSNPGDEGMGIHPGANVGGDAAEMGNGPQNQYYNINGGSMGNGVGFGLGQSGASNGNGGNESDAGNGAFGNGSVFTGTPSGMDPAMQRVQMGGGDSGTKPGVMGMSEQNTPLGSMGVNAHDSGVESSLNPGSVPPTNSVKPSGPSSIAGSHLPGDIDDGSSAKHLDNSHGDLPGDYDNMIHDDINNLFDDGAMNGDGGLDLGNDGINDLINFEDEDNGIMNDDAFDQDFLSQIDHSME